MEKKNQIPKYPHLRFPEFTDEWKEVTLGEVAEILMCKRILASQTNTISGVPFFKIGTIGKTPDCYITRELFDEYKLRYSYPKKGQVLLTCSGTIGRCWIFSGEDAYFQDSNIVWIDNPEYVLLNRYLYYILIKTDWSKLNSSTITRLYNDDLRRLKLRLPSLPEQRKIAALLSLIDERIEVQNAIIKEQEVAKTSLIRRLFDRTLRFPEFTDEWKVVKLGEVGEKQHAKNADDSIDRVYTNSAQDGIVEQTEFFDKEIANGNNLSGYYIVKQYDFVYNPRLSKTAPVGAMNLNKNTGIGLVSPLYTVFRITARSVLNEFLEYLFESTSWHGYMNEVANFGARSDRMNIKDKDFFNLPLRLPSLLEQRKIADLLSAVDERIAVEKEYATLLQKQKAYLLRQMFV